MQAMLERRRHFRGRVYYGGRITFNQRSSTMDCIVRNFSDSGAKVNVAHACLLSDDIDLTIPRKRPRLSRAYGDARIKPVSCFRRRAPFSPS